MYRTLVCPVFLLCLLAALPAQVVHVANYGGVPFDGWKRCTVDSLPPHPAGHVGGTGAGCHYVIGRRVGLDTYIVDVRLQLGPGQVASFDLATASPWNFVRGPLPSNPVAYFGQPRIGSTTLQPVSMQADGAAWLAHLRARTGRMLHTDLWVWWWPDQPGWAQGEVVVTASNPNVSDFKTVVPAGFRLSYGPAAVRVLDLPNGAPLLPEDTTMGDGQARSFPVVFIWNEHLGSTAELASAFLTAELQVCANGIARLWPDGNPRPPAGVSLLARNAANIAVLRTRLHNWQAGPLGVAAFSGQTGSQEDQVFIGGECMVMPEGLGGETARYLAALGQSRRPCHHLEPNGSQLSLTAHPQLVLWDSRAHWSTIVSPDRLGKLENLSRVQTHDWWGPDEEHLLLNTLTVAARLTGSPALQWQLSANARNFLFQKTVDPLLSTSRPGPARAVGWEGLAAVHFWTNLEDRVLAQRVAARWSERVQLVITPQLTGLPGGIWDPREDLRLSSTGWKVSWMPYQQSLGSWGLDYGCRLLGPQSGRALALHSALNVALRSFSWDGVQWKGWGYVGYAGGVHVPLVQGAGAHYGAGIEQWHTVNVATLLQYFPNDPIVSSMRDRFVSLGGSWVPPGM